jgi:uncharacterized protein (TIGR00255 family)
MTGFGAAEGRVGGGVLRIEIRSVNHRFFTLTLKAPAEFQALEGAVRERLRRVFERGHLTVQIRWLEASAAGAAAVRLDVDRAREAMARLRELQAAVGLGGQITLDLVARQPDVFRAVEVEPAVPDWGAFEDVLVRASMACDAMRRREGVALGAELGGRLDRLEEHRGQLAARAPERLARERERLRGQVSELLDGKAVDEHRLMQELAFVAERLDIREELVRLEAHLAACRRALDGDGAVGKQLGFLAQELGREINTIGSKANDASLQHVVVEMKGELERFREQLENLE